MSSTEPTSSKPILNYEQIAFYRDEGYLCLPCLIDAQRMIKLKASLAALVGQSRRMSASDGTFDLEDGHTADTPRLKRIAYLDDLDAVF
jgi:hypothetical protein